MPLQIFARLNEAKDLRSFTDEAVSYGRANGFNSCFILSPIARNSRQGRLLNNFGLSESWARAYRRVLHRFDPLPEIAFAYGRPFRLSLAGGLAALSKNELRYLALLDRYGLGDGYAFPVFGRGARAAIIVYGDHADLEAVSEATVLDMYLHLQMGYGLFTQMFARQSSPANELSLREKDVLFWLTQGKSNSAIAQILAISPATVDTYIRRTFRKLGVVDRVGAAMAAVQYGYVIPGEFRTPSQLP